MVDFRRPGHICPLSQSSIRVISACFLCELIIFLFIYTIVSESHSWLPWLPKLSSYMPHCLNNLNMMTSLRRMKLTAITQFTQQPVDRT